MNETPRIPEESLDQKMQALTLEIEDLLGRKAVATDPDALQALATMIILKREELAKCEMEQAIQKASKKP